VAQLRLVRPTRIMSFDHQRAIRAITRIELLVIIAIVAVIAAPIIRVVFADDFRAFDEALFRRLGVDPSLGRFVMAALAMVALASWACYRAWMRRRHARIEKLPFLRMPIHDTAKPRPNQTMQRTAPRSDA
jgi:hypothetical protein